MSKFALVALFAVVLFTAGSASASLIQGSDVGFRCVPDQQTHKCIQQP